MFIASKYGMPCSLGTNATLTWALPLLEPPPALAVSVFLLHPERARAPTSPTATTATGRFETFIWCPFG